MNDLIERLRIGPSSKEIDYEAAQRIEDLEDIIEGHERRNKIFQFALEYYSDWGTYNQHLLTMKTAESLRARAVQTLAGKV